MQAYGSLALEDILEAGKAELGRCITAAAPGLLARLENGTSLNDLSPWPN